MSFLTWMDGVLKKRITKRGSNIDHKSAKVTEQEATVARQRMELEKLRADLNTFKRS